MPNLDSSKKSFNYQPFFTLTWALLLVLISVNLIGTNILSTKGSIVSEVENKTLLLEKENQNLFVKIEELSTLQQLETLAGSRGYIRTKNIVFVPERPTFASR